MKRKWLLISLAVIAAVALVWVALAPEQRAAVTSAVGLTSGPPPAAQRKKPICSSTGIPVGDCMPQWEANLPPDPGEAGKATIEGIDSDKDGVRDDVQIFIAQKWGHSQRAVQALTLIAKSSQIQVIAGADLSKEEARKLVPDIMRKNVCYTYIETQEMVQARASDWVQVKVTNTPKRWLRLEAFNDHIAHQAYPLGDYSVTEACGFDPEALPN